MKAATVFKNGPSSQAVRIPKEFHLTTKEVWIERVGENLLIKPKPDSWEDFFYSPLKVSNDFSMERNQKFSQARKDIFE